VPIEARVFVKSSWTAFGQFGLHVLLHDADQLLAEGAIAQFVDVDKHDPLCICPDNSGVERGAGGGEGEEGQAKGGEVEGEIFHERDGRSAYHSRETGSGLQMTRRINSKGQNPNANKTPEAGIPVWRMI